MLGDSSAAFGGELAAGSALFEKIFEALPHNLLLLSPQFYILAVSDAYLESTLTQRQAIVGRYVFEVFPDNPYAPTANAVHNLKASLERVLETKQPHQMSLQHYDVPHPEAPGQFVERYWSPLNTPILDEKGKVSCIIHQVSNVTERVKTERLLLKSQANEGRGWAEADRQREQLYTLFREAPAPIVILDGEELVFELVNPAYQQIFPGRELLGKPLSVALPEVAATPILSILKKVYQTGETYVAKEVPLQLSRLEGAPMEEIYWTFTYQARRNGQGQVDGIFVFAYEVSDQIKARKAIESSQKEFKMLAESIPQLVWRATAEGYVDYYNQQWYTYSGLDYEQLKGEGWTRVVHPQDLPLLREDWNKSLQTGAAYQVETRLKGSNGTYRWFLVQALPLKGAQGRVEQWFGTNTDIDERKGSEAALQQLSGELKQSNSALRRVNVDLDNFVYMVSHDLRSPVNTLEGLQTLLTNMLASKLEAKESELFAHMRTSIEKLKSTLSDLSSIARLQQELGQPFEPVSFPGILEEITTELASLISQTKAYLEVDFGVETIPYPRAHLRSILYNLLSNALKYRAAHRPPRIEIATGREADQVWLSVRDNGLGIPKEQFDKVFAVFKRVHSHVEGSGVGLYMIKRMMENHGGTISFQSQLGVGTTFSVYFQA